MRMHAQMVARTAEIDSMAYDVNVGLHSGISIKSSAVFDSC